MIDRIWLHPPLAIARLGPSPVPCDNYHWGPSDLSPRGTGKTTVVPAVTLDLAADGTLSERMPTKAQFKDTDGWRPVCPYFELHATWTSGGERRTGPLTEAVLAESGLSPADLCWRVAVANLKAYHYTQATGDRVEAHAEVRGDDHTRHALDGTSPQDDARPLVPSGAGLPLGAVQLPAPNAALPELRLRFTPGAGAVYGPTDLATRAQGTEYRLPPERLILNRDAVWCGFPLQNISDDPRTVPGGLFAGAELEESLGLVDDVCDGTVVATLPGGLTATARIVVGPPDFAPDRRPFISLADGLADRVRRADVHDPAYLADERLTALEVRDLFERVLETMGNVNVEVQNGRFRTPPLEPPRKLTSVLLELTDRGRRRHRRYVALEALEDLLREQPGLLRRVVREPVPDEPVWDERMPVAMRGADSYALHLTRRQYDLLVNWSRTLREDTEAGS
ncbi:hypothetical protein J7I94_15955 [Streptomyces sp. ISL-12]|uniref:hypothetical protein n=1 Tax=Streptomyces sp. ISL-12 TaxID=2819177 RepID=UPI001BEA0239|nr:hypothetical protein [Streptomyces sp. ISL-12]MBT2412045.1 hypothetical protein [Streptomyces sp. ISL-12]